MKYPPAFLYPTMILGALLQEILLHGTLLRRPLLFATIGLALGLSSLTSTAAADSIYKYKDEQGHWHFGDKKPASNTNYKEIAPATTKKKQTPSVVFHIDRKSQPQKLIAENQFYTPITLRIEFEDHSQNVNTVLKSRAQQSVYSNAGGVPKFKYRYLLGDPNAKPEDFAYATPFAAFDSHKITQAFNGRFSHQHDGSRYAIDIQLPVGTYIAAARAGTVVSITDGFVIGGVSSKYFLDKANRVLVAHGDGSFATYVHLLTGSIAVKPGDQVTEGDILGRSGSSGYSSGPHLHFAILRPSESGLVSTPFHLRDSNGSPVTPLEKQMLSPARKPPP
jgi:murein DD-endopeptidase MepM/ murein hydrolase activator NlpD